MQQKKWTNQLGHRDPSQGPWIDLLDMQAFRQFCQYEDIQIRDTGHEIQVRHGGHWMALRYNKNLKRYTADRRLTLIVQSFAAQKSKSPERGETISFKVVWENATPKAVVNALKMIDTLSVLAISRENFIVAEIDDVTDQNKMIDTVRDYVWKVNSGAYCSVDILTEEEVDQYS